jgi:ribosomal protein S19
MRRHIVILSGLVLLTMFVVNGAFATPVTIHDEFLTVSDNLTLFAITRIGQTDYNSGNGIAGGITVQTDGIG